MLWMADALYVLLLPFIIVIATLLLAAIAAIVVERLVRSVRDASRARATDACRPFVDAWLSTGADDALSRLVSECRGHRAEAAFLLLRPLRSMRGDLVARSRTALDALEIPAVWLRDLRDRRWWKRAKAAQALGLIAYPASADALVARLEDEHGEVRAMALEALGRLADPSTLAVIAHQLGNPRQQQVRVIAALQAFGAAASERLAQWGQGHAAYRASVAEALGQIGSTAGLSVLLDWMADADPSVRAACLRAASDIGLDDRFYYYVLRALGDPHPEVRAMAARALGRSGRAESSEHLARLLTDEWTVAARSAAALKRLGETGRRCLTAVADAGGAGAELARRTLWDARG